MAQCHRHQIVEYARVFLSWVCAAAPRAGSGRRVSGRSLRLRLVAAGGAAVLGALGDRRGGAGGALRAPRGVSGGGRARGAPRPARRRDRARPGRGAGGGAGRRIRATASRCRGATGRWRPGGATFASRSLWDALLALPPAPAPRASSGSPARGRGPAGAGTPADPAAEPRRRAGDGGGGDGPR